MFVKDIFIYPVKSLGGIQVNQAKVLERGFQHDRRMMLANEYGKFITQREFPQLALIGSKFSEDGFTFFKKSDSGDEVYIPHNVILRDFEEVQLWDDVFLAAKIKSDVHAWFSDVTGIKTFMYKMGDKSNRTKELIKPAKSIKLSMADGYPYLMISEASLQDLNDRMDAPVTMDRFRPSIIIAESEPYQEEALKKFEIRNIGFRMIKKCARCIIININQKSAKKLVEPLKTLSLYKKDDNYVYFGMYGIALDSGTIKIGDVISEI